MASRSPQHLVHSRDRELLTALDWAPMTARQLLKLSATWPQPFRSQRNMRDRLQQLGEVGLVRSFRYAAVDPGQPENYYQLSREGYRTVHGPDAVLPTKGYGAEVAISRQLHTRALADVLVHTAVAAHRSRIVMTGVYRENSLRLSAGQESVYPDAAFILVAPDQNTYRFFLEIDCGTERVRSDRSDQSWERKLQVYDQVQDQWAENRFRVLIVTVRSGPERLERILNLAGRVQRSPHRTLFYGATLYAYLGSTFAATSPLFADHRGRRQSLVLGNLSPREEPRSQTLIAPVPEPPALSGRLRSA